MRATRAIVVGCVPLILACGGLGATVDAGSHLQRLCAAVPEVPLPADLALAHRDGLPVAATWDGPALVVGPDRAEVNGTPTTDLTSALMTAWDQAEALGDGRQPPLLFLEAATPVARVAEVFQQVHDAGGTRVLLYADSGEPWDLPEPPAPELADALRAELDGADPSTRAMTIADRLGDAVAQCPPAEEVFQAIAAASSDQQCEMLAVGLDEALPPCVLTDYDAVVTLVHVMLEPRLPSRLTAVPVTLDPEALPLDVKGTETWQAVLDQVRTPLWLTVL